MSDKVLVIRKPDRTIRFVELSNEPALQAHVAKLPEGEKWTFEKMSRGEAEKLGPFDNKYVSPAQAKSQLADANEEIKKLREQLATRGASPDGAGQLLGEIHKKESEVINTQSAQAESLQSQNGQLTSTEDTGKKTSAADLIKQIGEASTKEEVKELLADDERVTVQEAAKEKLKELKAATK
jgi:hypothetical protein